MRSLIALLVAALLAGCAGGDNGGSGPTPTTITNIQQGGTIEAPNPYGGSKNTTPTNATPTASPTPDGGETASEVQVGIVDFAFDPQQVEVTAGQAIVWTNADGSTHTVTFDDAPVDSGPLPEGKSFSHTFDEAGTYAYHCEIHPGMTGSVVVA